MTTQGLYSRNNNDDILTILFAISDRYVYFIENPITHAWITKSHNWTIQPDKALSFKNKMAALSYKIRHLKAEYIITEHEFIDGVSTKK